VLERKGDYYWDGGKIHPAPDEGAKTAKKCHQGDKATYFTVEDGCARKGSMKKFGQENVEGLKLGQQQGPYKNQTLTNQLGEAAVELKRSYACTLNSAKKKENVGRGGEFGGPDEGTSRYISSQPRTDAFNLKRNVGKTRHLAAYW